MDELAGLLSRERRLLEVLLFKLVTARQLLSAGETRFLAWAAAEVERAVERVREAELLRASVVHKLAKQIGLPDDRITLTALAAESPEPYRGIFDDHRAAFAEIVDEIETVTRANRALASKGIKDVTDVLAMIDIGGNPESDVLLYGPDAHVHPAAATPAPSRFDGTL